MTQKDTKKFHEPVHSKGLPSYDDLQEYLLSHMRFTNKISDFFEPKEWEEILKNRNALFLRFAHYSIDQMALHRASHIVSELIKGSIKGGVIDILTISLLSGLCVYVTGNLLWAASSFLIFPLLILRISRYLRSSILTRILVQHRSQDHQNSYRSLEKISPNIVHLTLAPYHISQLALVSLYFNQPSEVLKYFKTLNMHNTERNEDYQNKIWGFDPFSEASLTEGSLPILGHDVIDSIIKSKFLILSARLYNHEKFLQGFMAYLMEEKQDFVPNYFWDLDNFIGRKENDPQNNQFLTNMYFSA